MTSKVNSIYESILSSMSSPSLVPVGPITISSEPVECDGEDCNVEELDDNMSETEIANKIITKAKKLRKKIGEDSYHYIRSIIDLAEKLLELYPEMEISGLEESVDNPDHLKLSISHVYDVLAKNYDGNAVDIPAVYDRLDGVSVEDFKHALADINDTNFEGLYLEPHDNPRDATPEEQKFFFSGLKYSRIAKF